MVLFDRLLSLLVAVALLAFGVLVVVEVVHTALGLGGHVVLPWESLARYGRSHAWNSNLVRLVCAAVAACGALLLLAELRRRTPAVFTVTTGDDTVTAGLTRRSLRRALRAQAGTVAGVASARARVRRRTATVWATTFLEQTSEVRDRLAAHLDEWMASLGLVRRPTLNVWVRKERH